MPMPSQHEDLLCLIPAGGYGSRLGVLTAEQAKPSLPISFDAEGTIRRMIDMPLEAVRHVGGTAIVSLFFAPESLKFVEDYAAVTTHQIDGPSTAIGSILRLRETVIQSQAKDIGIIPGDAYVTPGQIEGLYAAHIASEADATLLSTRHTAGHNIRPVDHKGMMAREDNAVSHAADLGIHIINAGWLLERLTSYADDDVHTDIWDDVYTVSHPSGNFLMHTPVDDNGWVDMGTPPAYYQTLTSLNHAQSDTDGNIVFPGASIAADRCRDTVALPGSTSFLEHNRAILPEGAAIQSAAQAVIIE